MKQINKPGSDFRPRTPENNLGIVSRENLFKIDYFSFLADDVYCSKGLRVLNWKLLGKKQLVCFEEGKGEWVR